MSGARLTARIELATGAGPAGTVAIVNDGDEPVRLWRPGNSWGDDALTFEAGGTRFVREADYTRNAPSAVDVAPGAAHALPFDLADATWTGGPPPGPGDRLVAVYLVPETPEAADQRVWIGCVRSAPVELR